MIQPMEWRRKVIMGRKSYSQSQVVLWTEVFEVMRATEGFDEPHISLFRSFVGHCLRLVMSEVWFSS